MSRRHRRGLAPRLLRLGAVCLLIFLFGAAGSLAATPEEAEAYDLRAARALFNTIRPDAVPEASGLPADLPRSLTVWDVDGDKRTYALNFGTRGGDFDDRGYFKIVLNGQLSDAGSKGWEVLAASDETTGAEVLWKRVERSSADRFTDIGVRRKIGNVVLTFAQRRPLDEAPATSAREALARFAVLLEQAKENKLFARVAIWQIAPDGSERELDLATEPLRFSVAPGSQPTEIRLRVEVLDAEDQPIRGVERFSFQVAGRLEPFVTLGGADWDPATERWHVRQQGAAEVTLRLDPAGGRLLQELYGPFASSGTEEMKVDPGIRLRVGVKLAQAELIAAGGQDEIRTS